MSLDIGSFNGVFFGAISRGEATQEKVAAAVGTYIQEKIRESGVARRILDFQTVTPTECQITDQHNGLTFFVDIEPQSVAMTVAIRGNPQTAWIEKKVMPITFKQIGTKEWNAVEEELMASRAPILKIIEQNSLKDMQAEEDISFLKQVNACAFASTYRLNPAAQPVGVTAFTLGSQVDTWFQTVARPSNSNIFLSTNTYFRKDVLTELSQTQSMRQLEMKLFLLHKATYDETLRWLADEVGHSTADKITVDGYREKTVGGFTFVTTIKTNREFVRPGHLYGFADKAALGKFLQLTGTKFWINKRANVITMRGWETIGMGIGNINACSLVLIAGSLPVDIYVPTGVNTAIGAPNILRIYPHTTVRPGGAPPHL